MTETVSLIADLHMVRCGGCKVLVDDPLETKCSVCGATFDRVVSNHVGLARRLNSDRGLEEEEPVAEPAPAPTADSGDLVAVPRSLLSDLAAASGDGVSAALAKLAESAPGIGADDVASAAGDAATAAREAGSLA